MEIATELASPYTISEIKKRLEAYTSRYLSRQVGTAGRQHLRSRQLQRRFHITEIARGQIEQKGFNAVSLRGLAAACGLSPHTIYDLIGNSDQVVLAAVAETVTLIHGTASTMYGYPNLLAALADVIWHYSIEHPDYSAQVSLNYFDMNSFLRHAIEKYSLDPIRSALTPLLSDSALRSRTIYESLPARVLDVLECAIFNRKAHNWEPAPFRWQLQSSLGLMLMGISSRDHARLIDDWLENNEFRWTVPSAEVSPASASPCLDDLQAAHKRDHFTGDIALAIRDPVGKGARHDS